eukprot:TRINITY_DN41670_c0_g2_i1.p1 TRINITY_DN41670_c0_g2~~TRINITY_DN41670_c0_g2_i1.p1  ORF type:complete len:598 (-),score=105.56 TRINITY_DN41670_c0_g2_i1:130-1884(-)
MGASVGSSFASCCSGSDGTTFSEKGLPRKERTRASAAPLVKRYTCVSIARCIKSASGPEGASRGPAELRAFYQDLRAFLSKYDLGFRMLCGLQSTTIQAKDQKTRKDVVLKKLHTAKDAREFARVRQTVSPHLARILDLFGNGWGTIVVTEFCHGGTLLDAAEAVGRPTHNWCAGIFYQALRGVSHLHATLRQPHNNIRPENILLERRPTCSTDVPRIMVADFGCSAARGVVTQLTDGIGDPRYRAPETFTNLALSPQTDVWALGVTLFEMVTGGLLIYVNRPNPTTFSAFTSFEGGNLCSEFLSAIKGGKPISFEGVLDTDTSMFNALRDLIRSLLHKNPQARPMSSAAMQHEWFLPVNGQLCAMCSDNEVVPLGQGTAERLFERATNRGILGKLNDLVTSALHADALSFYQGLWNRIDKTLVGQLDLEDFRRVMSTVETTCESKDHVDAIVTSVLAATSIVTPGVKDEEQRQDTTEAKTSRFPSAETLFELGDTERSGHIRFQNFADLMFSIDEVDDGDKIRYLKTVFEGLTADGGRITAKDFAGVFRGQDTSVIYEVFRRIEGEGNGYVDFTEFVRFLDHL